MEPIKSKVHVFSAKNKPVATCKSGDTIVRISVPKTKELFE